MGFLLDTSSSVMCSHSGQATPTVPNPRVRVNSQPTVTQSAPYTVAGCPFNVSGSPVPCVTGQWVSAAVRVKSGGVPVLTQESVAITAPNGVPLVVTSTQVRVKGM